MEWLSPTEFVEAGTEIIIFINLKNRAHEATQMLAAIFKKKIEKTENKFKFLLLEAIINCRLRLK